MKKAILILVILVLTVGGYLTFTVLNSTTIIEGYSLKSENGSYMIIEDSGSPICYKFNRAIGTDVEKLTDGDRIFIISDLINETYPGSTSAYVVIKLADGDISYIDRDTLVSLSELGWYKFTE